MSDYDTGNALPSRFYGDPADCVDELRRLNEYAKKKKERDRRHKSMRIKAQVKKVMQNGGHRKGK